MICPTCSHNNDDWRKFCGECGNTLVCHKCKAVNLDGGKFCGECGENLKIDLFTSEGETIGYVSLDQAGVLAIQNALQNTEEYQEQLGSESAALLSFQVASATEEEDYYYITLRSMLPGRQDGPGEETAIIDKTGAIVLRQIHKWPVIRTSLG